MFDNFILIIFDPRTHENSPELRRRERVRGGPRGHIWVLDPAADTTLILRHLRGEIGFYDFKNWNIFLIFSLSTFSSLLIGSRYLLDCRTQGKQELIVTINSFPDGDIDLFLTANQRTGLRLSDQWEAVQQSSYNSCNWVCNHVSLCYKCHISDITGIRSRVTAQNADLYRDKHLTAERSKHWTKYLKSPITSSSFSIAILE